MSKESYARGFVKVAQLLSKAAALPPQELRTALSAPSGLKKTNAENLMNDAVKFMPKVESNPTEADWQSLFSLDPDVVQKAMADSGFTVNDWMTSMSEVSPQWAALIMSAMKQKAGDMSKRLDRPLADQVRYINREALSDPKMKKIPVDFRNLQYATATNLAAKVKGKPIWNVAKAAPTAYGMGLKVK